MNTLRRLRLMALKGFCSLSAKLPWLPGKEFSLIEMTVPGEADQCP